MQFLQIYPIPQWVEPGAVEPTDTEANHTGNEITEVNPLASRDWVDQGQVQVGEGGAARPQECRAV